MTPTPVPTFVTIPHETLWPSLDYFPIALIEKSGEQVEALTGVPLLQGEEAGLGPWVAAALRFQSGSVVELICYRHSPAPGFVVNVDSDCDPKVALADIVQLFGITLEDVSWVSPDAG